MKIVKDINEFNIDTNTSVALGNFDGLHIGHKELIKTLVAESKNNSTKSLVFTFHPHPLKILAPEKAPQTITSLKEKIQLIKNLNVDILALITFTHSFSKITPKKFIDDLLIKKLKAKLVVVGYNFTFGFNAEGTTVYLKKQKKEKNLDVIVVPPVKYKGKVVSSTYIRKLIVDGEIELANCLLGHPYTIEGKVVLGKGLGKKLGFPTANIKYNPEKILPKFGVYVVGVKVKNKYYKGVVNIGKNPTVSSRKINVEVYILDFDETIYGENIKILFYKHLRDEKKFDSFDELKARIMEDVNIAENFFHYNSNNIDNRVNLFTNWG